MSDCCEICFFFCIVKVNLKHDMAFISPETLSQCRKKIICSEQLIPLAVSFAEQLLYSPCQKVLYNTVRLISDKQKGSVHLKKLINRLSMVALASFKY